VVLPQAVVEIYSRSEAALLSAHNNVEKSRERAERVYGLSACSLLASAPLWCETSSPLLASDNLNDKPGRLARVAQTAISGISALLNGERASLSLMADRKTGSSKMEVFRRRADGQGSSRIVHKMVDRPSGNGSQAGLMGRCIKKGVVINVMNARAEERYNAKVDGECLGTSTPTSILFLPLKCASKSLMGILQVGVQTMMTCDCLYDPTAFDVIIFVG